MLFFIFFFILSFNKFYCNDYLNDLFLSLDIYENICIENENRYFYFSEFTVNRDFSILMEKKNKEDSLKFKFIEKAFSISDLLNFDVNEEKEYFFLDFKKKGSKSKILFLGFSTYLKESKKFVKFKLLRKDFNELCLLKKGDLSFNDFEFDIFKKIYD